MLAFASIGPRVSAAAKSLGKFSPICEIARAREKGLGEHGALGVGYSMSVAAMRAAL
jgi:hypothetical protein